MATSVLSCVPFRTHDERIGRCGQGWTWQASHGRGRAPLRQLELAKLHEGQRLMSEWQAVLQGEREG